MPRGRPKGSKNSTKVAQNNDKVVRNDGDHNTKIVGLSDVKRPQIQRNIDPEWVLTETLRGTPVAIEAICNGSKGSADCFFLVIPNYKTNTHKTMVAAASLIKPEILTDEQAVVLKDVVFGSNEVASVGEKTIVAEDALVNSVVESDPGT